MAGWRSSSESVCPVQACSAIDSSAQDTSSGGAIRLITELREGNHVLLRRWMSSLSPDDLAALTRGWRALAEVASRHGAVLENSAV